MMRDSVATIVSRYEHDETPGLRAQFAVSAASLARNCGNPKGQKIYTCREDLLDLYRAKYCEARH